LTTNWDDLKDGHVSFADLLSVLFRRRFTGPVTIHFLRGKPELYEVGRPKKLRLSRTCLTRSVRYVENGVDQGPE
jgi:hypothetical protein